MRHATQEGQMLSLEQANLYDRARCLSTSDLIREATKLGYNEGHDEGYQDGLAEGKVPADFLDEICHSCYQMWWDYWRTDTWEEEE